MITEDIILSELITSEWLQVACTLYKEEAMGRIYNKSEMDGMESEVTYLMSWACIRLSRKPLPDSASRKPLPPALEKPCQKSISAENCVQADF